MGVLPTRQLGRSLGVVKAWRWAAVWLVTLACEPAPHEPREFLFEAGGEFWDSPFPSEHRRRASGEIALDGLPNPDRLSVVASVRRLLDASADGFGVSSTIYFRADGPLAAARLPSLESTAEGDAEVFLLDVDPRSPARGEQVPLRVGIVSPGGALGAPELLALQPLQGWPLREDTLYAAVVLRSFGGFGEWRASAALRRLLEGRKPDGFTTSAIESYRAALEGLAELGTNLQTLAALTVFRTGRPSEGFFRFEEATRQHRPRLGAAPWSRKETFDEFCVYEAEISVPLFQRGLAPYPLRGGGWPRDPALATPRLVPSRLVLTVPRSAAPPKGHPVALFVRTGGGGDRPLVDRGRRATPGGPAVVPGTGPALELARAGYAGLSWDGPHGGLRNPTGGDEQFLVFNFSNPEALRDNVRQTALEAVMLAAGVGQIEVPEPCLRASRPRLDPARVSLMGHSMGATIAPLAAATGRFEALLLSGAGGSWIENVLYKESPLRVRPLAALLLGHDLGERKLGRFDPVLALLQWAGEPADPPIYFRRAREEGLLPHILMMQAIGDTYIPAPVANAASLAARLDLAGRPELGHEPLLALVGAQASAFPLGANREAGLRTAVLTQHLGGPIEDPHEVVFQTEEPKTVYRCFLMDLASGQVPAAHLNCR